MKILIIILFIFNSLFFLSCNENNPVQPPDNSLKITPEAPSDLSFTHISANEIILNWVDNSSNEKGFVIERDNEDDIFVKLAEVDSNITSYIDSTLDTNKFYRYRIEAFINKENPSFSEEIKITYVLNDINLLSKINNINFYGINKSETFFSYYHNLPIYIIDINSGIIKFLLNSPKQNSINATDFNFDGTIFSAGASSNEINIWDLNTGKLITTLVLWTPDNSIHSVNSIKFGIKSSILFSSQDDSTIYKWSWDTNTFIKNYHRKFNFLVKNLAITPDDKILAFQNTNNEIILLNSLDGSIFRTLTNSANISNFRISYDGKFVIGVSNLKDLIIWQISDGVIKNILHNPTVIKDFALNFKNKHIVTFDNSNNVYLWDVEKSTLVISTKFDFNLGQLKSVSYSKFSDLIYANVGATFVKWIFDNRWKLKK